MAQPTIPSFETLFNDIYGDLKTETSAGQTLIGRIALRALALVQAGSSKLEYLAIARVQKNVSPTTADPVDKGGTLEEFGELKLERGPFQADNGLYTVTVTGQEGGQVDITNQLLSSNDSDNPGFLFEPTEAKTILVGDSSVEVPIRAITASKEAELSIGNTLGFTQPIVKIDSTATVLTVDKVPTDGETVEEYRAKVVEAEQLETQGGAPSDYRIWLNDVQGARTVFPTLPQGGDVNAYVEAFPDDSTDGNGTPPASMLTEVAEIFEFDPDTTKPLDTRGRRPAGVINLNVLAVSPLPVIVTINGLTDQSAETVAGVTAAIKLFLFDVRPFIAGASDPLKQNDTLYLGALSAVVSQALPPGEFFVQLTMTVSGGSETDFNFVNGNIPYLDSVELT